MKLSDLKQPPAKILLYGPPGGGKSLFAATLGEGTIYIDVQGNECTSAKIHKDLMTVERHKIDVKPDKIGGEKPEVLFEKSKNYIMEVVNLKTPPKAVVFDNLTTYGEGAMRWIIRNSGKLQPNGDITTASGGPEIQHYGLAMAEIQKAIILLRSLPCTVVVVCHQEMKPVSDKENIIEMLVLGEKLAPKLPAYFDEVWYLKANQESGGVISYKIRTKHSGTIVARSRGGLPEFVDTNLGMRKVLEMAGYAV